MVVLVQGGSLSTGGVGDRRCHRIAALLALAVHEIGTPEPMLPLELWRQHRVIVVGSIGGAVISAVMTGVSAFLPT